MQKSMLKNSVFNIIYTASNILFPFITFDKVYMRISCDRNTYKTVSIR